MKISDLKSSLLETSTARFLLKDLPRKHPIFALLHHQTLDYPYTNLSLPANMTVSPSSQRSIEQDRMDTGIPSRGWLVIGPKSSVVITRYSTFESRVYAIKPTTLVPIFENVNVLFAQLRRELSDTHGMRGYADQTKEEADEVWEAIYEYTGPDPEIWQLGPERRFGDPDRRDWQYHGATEVELMRSGFQWQESDPAQNLLRRRQASWEQDLMTAKQHRDRIIDEFSDTQGSLPMIRSALEEKKVIEDNLITLERLPWHQGSLNIYNEYLPIFLLNCMRAAYGKSFSRTENSYLNYWGTWTSQLSSGVQQAVDQHNPQAVQNHQRFLSRGAKQAAEIMKEYQQQLLVIHKAASRY